MARTGRYSKVERRVWGDAKFLKLSRSAPSAQVLWLYLLTGPHNTVVPGLFVAVVGELAEKLGWPRDATAACLAEITACGMAKYDPETGLFWLPNAVKYNPPPNPNVVVGWMSSWQELPECPLRDEARDKFSSFMKDAGATFVEAFQACLSGKSTRQSTNPSGRRGTNGSINRKTDGKQNDQADSKDDRIDDRSPDGTSHGQIGSSANQEQEQEQEQDPPQPPAAARPPAGGMGWATVIDAKQAIIRGIGGRMSFHVGLSMDTEKVFKSIVERWRSDGVDVEARLETFGRWLVSGGSDGRGGLSWVQKTAVSLEWAILRGGFEKLVSDAEAWSLLDAERRLEEEQRDARAAARAAAPGSPRDPAFYAKLRAGLGGAVASRKAAEGEDGDAR